MASIYLLNLLAIFLNPFCFLLVFSKVIELSGWPCLQASSNVIKILSPTLMALPTKRNFALNT
jgi:hypothetical protein